MVLVQQGADNPQQARFVGFPMWQGGGGGAVVGYRLNGERLLCWRGTIRAALEFVVFLLKIVSGRGRWRAKGD